MGSETIRLLSGIMALFLLVLFVLRRRRRRALTRERFR
jgi:MYXO-CTERM domain-containing protein